MKFAEALKKIDPTGDKYLLAREIKGHGICALERMNRTTAIRTNLSPTGSGTSYFYRTVPEA